VAAAVVSWSIKRMTGSVTPGFMSCAPAVLARVARALAAAKRTRRFLKKKSGAMARRGRVAL